MKRFFLLIPCILIAVAALHAQSLHLTSTRFIGGTGSGTWPKYAMRTADHGILVCGTTYDTGSGDIPHVATTNDSGNILLIKLDSLGNKQWVKVYGTVAPESGVSAYQAEDGGFVVLTGVSTRKGDIKIDRLDSAGNLKWTKIFGSSQTDGGFNVISTSDKGMLICGVSKGSDGDIPFNYRNPPIAFQPMDWILIKLDSLGNKQWVKVLGSSDDEQYANVTTDGSNYYLAGGAHTKDHDCVDSVGRSGFSGYSPYVIKLDSAGNKIWSNTYGEGIVGQIMFDARDSSIVVVGATHGGYEFGNTAGSIDFYLMKLDRDGNLLWAKLYGDANDDEGGVVCAAPNGGYYVGGISWYFMPTGNKHIGGADAWVFLLDSVGNMMAEKILGSKDDEQRVCGVFSLSRGAVVVGMTLGYQFSEGGGHNYVNQTPGVPSIACYSSLLQLWPVGISSASAGQTLLLRPNPALNTFIVQLGKRTGILRCTNMQGRVVYQKEVISGKDSIEIDTHTWMRGTYSVCLIEAGRAEIFCAKILVGE